MVVKRIKGFSDYAVSDTGNVYSLKNKQQAIKLKPILTQTGYLTVSLRKDSKSYVKRIHRLVMETFVSNVKKLPQVNHKDGNKTNNRIENLEWCTCSENLKHAYRVLKRPPSHSMLGRLGIESPTHIPVLQIKNNTIVAKFYGLHEACRKTGVCYQNIYKCCKGKRETAGGFQWKYERKEESLCQPQGTKS